MKKMNRLKAGLNLPDSMQVELASSVLRLESVDPPGDLTLDDLADHPERLLKVKRYVRVDEVLLKKMRYAQGIRLYLADAELFVRF